jgi:hypothetical protein
LVRSNSNAIWESSLLGNHNENKQQGLKSVKKPTPKDSNTTKLNYIKQKYENLAFIARGKYSSIDELNQQLIKNVKTANYEMTLRILSQGADPNYKSQHDGSSCLQVAVLYDQIGQIEILSLYGADIVAVDRNGNTPLDYAKAKNYQHIVDRLLELQFELTDEFIYYATNKRVDHRTEVNLCLPDIDFDIYDYQNDETHGTKPKLEELPDHLFQELSKDVYDELDRRQIELIWKSSVGPTLINEPVPFLIIKSCFSQTRNQLRQKLARFSAQEFSNLIIQILKEVERRYFEKQNKDNSNNRSQIYEDDDEPLYDRVPSDEDYASVANDSINNEDKLKKKQKLSKLAHSSTFTKSDKISDDRRNDNKSPLKNKTLSPSPFSAKVLTTNFDKPKVFSNNNNNAPKTPSHKVANAAESALNLIIDSLNQFDIVPTVADDEFSIERESSIKTQEQEQNDVDLMQSMVVALF